MRMNVLDFRADNVLEYITGMATKVKFTYEDYLLTEEGKHYELIDGDLLLTPAPNISHHDSAKELFTLLLERLEKKGLGKVFIAPVDVVFSETDVVQPDLLFISKDRLSIVTKKNIQGAPDLIIEILSPESEKRDRVLKRKLYHRNGVKEYWLVDTESKTIEVLTLSDGDYKTHAVVSENSTLTSPAFPTLSFSLKTVFPE